VDGGLLDLPLDVVERDGDLMDGETVRPKEVFHKLRVTLPHRHRLNEGVTQAFQLDDVRSEIPVQVLEVSHTASKPFELRRRPVDMMNCPGAA
jgi:hypothetical protein